MKIISSTLVVLLLCVLSTTSGQSANVVAPQPPSISSGVARTACVPEAADLGAVCGYVRVPFDRMHPKQGTIRIYFELYRHSDSGPAESAILVNFGGPGVTTSGLRGLAFDFFGRNLDVHDMLLIDDRGRGFSEALGVTNCLEVQQGTVPWDQAWQTARRNWEMPRVGMGRVMLHGIPRPFAPPLGTTRWTISDGLTAVPMSPPTPPGSGITCAPSSLTRPQGRPIWSRLCSSRPARERIRASFAWIVCARRPVPLTTVTRLRNSMI